MPAYLFCFFALLSIKIAVGQDHAFEDFCVDRAFQSWHLSMVTKYYQYAPFIASMSSSRALFQTLFTQDFTTDSFKAFCKIHADARKLYDNCQDSDAQTTATIEFALADHVCIKRLEAYSRHMPCLQSTNKDAFDKCKNVCSTFEKDSNRFMHPAPEDLSDNRMNWIPYMASDCQYLKCTTECRRPIFKAKCQSDEAADLEYNALRAAFAKKINYYDPPAIRNAMRDSGFGSLIFPAECEELADDITPAPGK